MKIKVKYRGKWYLASSVYITRDGELSFEYLHGLYGSVDSDHVEEFVILGVKEMEVKDGKN